MRKTTVLTALVYGCLLASCSSSNDQKAPAPTPKQVLQGDLEAMKTMDFQRAGVATNQDSFSWIFGGRTSTAVTRYLNERLHYFYSEDELNAATLTPSTFVHEGWSKDPDQDQKMKKAGAEVGAANIGMGLWFQGALDGVTPVVTIGSQKISLDSPRAGMMLIGAGYRSSLTISSGQVIALPAEYRVSILLHEARHSDCTGGLTQAQLEVARNSSSAQDFNDHFTGKSCGHMHIKCPAGHEFEGLPACDGEAWGAYSVGAIFDREAAASLTGVNQRIMEAVAADDLSRVLVNTDSMLNGRLGRPDMSSSGIRN